MSRNNDCRYASGHVCWWIEPSVAGGIQCCVRVLQHPQL